MKTLDLNNKETFRKFQNALMKTMDEQYEVLSVKDTLKEADAYSFSTIVCLFEEITKDLYDSQKGKKCLKEYVETLKGNKSLLNAFSFLTSMKKPIAVSSPSLFVNESLSLVNEIKKREFLDGLKKLRKIVKEGLIISKKASAEIERIVNESKTEVMESIEYFLNNKKGLKNIAEYSNNISILSENVQKNLIPIKEDNENSKNVAELLEQINETATELTKGEKEAISELSLATISGKDEKEVFETFKNKCKDILMEAIKGEETIESISRFQKMLEGVEQKEYNKDTITDDILNFARLCETLEEHE